MLFIVHKQSAKSSIKNYCSIQSLQFSGTMFKLLADFLLWIEAQC